MSMNAHFQLCSSMDAVNNLLSSQHARDQRLMLRQWQFLPSQVKIFSVQIKLNIKLMTHSAVIQLITQAFRVLQLKNIETI